MNNSASINAVWQQNERTASAEHEKSLCPPSYEEMTGTGSGEQEEDERDYAEEAFRIMAGKSMLLAERAHLFALKLFYEEIIKEINGKVRDAMMEGKK